MDIGAVLIAVGGVGKRADVCVWSIISGGWCDVRDGAGHDMGVRCGGRLVLAVDGASVWRSTGTVIVVAQGHIIVVWWVGCCGGCECGVR